jgi:dihydrofolate reductase
MNAIFGVNAINGFAIGDTMPWDHCKEDLIRFKKYTLGNIVLMGKNTWESNMPKPLPQRRNCVLSSSLIDDRCEVYSDIPSFLSSVKDTSKVWVIGGVNVLWQMRPYIKRVYMSQFHSNQQSDIYLDVDKYLENFKIISKEMCYNHNFKIYESI